MINPCSVKKPLDLLAKFFFGVFTDLDYVLVHKHAKNNLANNQFNIMM